MSENHTDTARLPSQHMVDSLRRWQDADRAAAEPLVPGVRVLEAHRTVIEHAKGALMLRYGIDSHQGFAVLVRWARASHTPVVTVADALVHGVCEGNPQTELRQPALLRWLEKQLRQDTPDGAPLPTASRARPVA